MSAWVVISGVPDLEKNLSATLGFVEGDRTFEKEGLMKIFLG